MEHIFRQGDLELRLFQKYGNKRNSKENSNKSINNFQSIVYRNNCSEYNAENKLNS
jgi:hypothetical protein